MKKVIRTLTGDKPADSFGPIYYHDHLITGNLKDPSEKNDMILADVDKMTQELLLFKKAGGTLLGEGSVIDFGENAHLKKEISEKAGVDVVATVGFGQKENEPPQVKNSTTGELFARVMDAAKNGYGRDKLRPGQLKFGTSYNFISDSESRCAHAVARAQRETDLPLFTHTGLGTMSLEQIALLESEGANLEHCCIGHMDLNLDLWVYKQVLRNGVYLGFDQLGKIKYATDQMRIELIIALVRAGYGDRLLISGDMARQSYMTAYGGGPGFSYILTVFLPRLKMQMADEGFSHREIEKVVDELIVRNPRAYFSIDA